MRGPSCSKSAGLTSRRGPLIFIAGGGALGSKALSDMRKAMKNARILVVDVNESCSARGLVDAVVPEEELSEERLKAVESMLVIGDAARVLSKALRIGFRPEIVVPAIPKHFTAYFLKQELEARGHKVIPAPHALEEVLRLFPRDLVLSASAESAMFTSSYMPYQFKCTIPCAQPNICPVTGRFKSKPMFELIRNALRSVDMALVLESRKISEFSGGFDFNELWSFIRELEAGATKEGLVLAIATACKCHGVVNFFEVTRLRA
jgi:hypothetical protein